MIFAGQPVAALPLLARAIDISPTVAGWASRNACHSYLALGRYDEAIESGEKAAAEDDFWTVHECLAAAYGHKGDAARAAAAKARLLQRRPEFTIEWLKEFSFSNNVLYREQEEAHNVTALRKAGIPER